MFQGYRISLACIAAFAWAGCLQAATVTVSIVTTPPSVESAFVVEMGGNAVTLHAGDMATDDEVAGDRYTLILPPSRDFELTQISCSDRSTKRPVPGNVNLAAGGVIIELGTHAVIDCVFALQAQLATVRATIVTDRPDVEAEFTLDMAGKMLTLSPDETATDSHAAVGGYAMTLNPPRSFKLQSIECTNQTSDEIMPANVTLATGGILINPAAGAEIDCVFALQAQLTTVTASVTTDEAVVEQEFTVQMNGHSATMLQNELATDRNAPANIYRMALLRERGFRLQDIECVRNEERVPAEIQFENQSVAFTPGTGADVHCTFHLNALRTSVTAKVVTNRATVETPFRLELNGETAVVMQGDIVTGPQGSPDLYRIALLPLRHFRLTDIACIRVGDDARLPATIDPTNQSIAFAPGEASVDCTFTLQALRARVTATVAVQPGSQPHEFTVDMNGDQKQVMLGETVADDDANSGIYRLALLPERGYGLNDIVCTGPEGDRINAFTDTRNFSIGFSPGVGNSVDCVFSLQRETADIAAIDSTAPTGGFPGSGGGGLSIDPDGRPRITLPGLDFDPTPTDPPTGGGSASSSPADQVATDCCSCTNLQSLIPVTERAGMGTVPCQFDIPSHWQAATGNDGLTASFGASVSCNGSCGRSAPAIGMMIATGPNNNADVQESVWRQVFNVVGSGQCGEGSVTFYQPPHNLATDPIGGVRFHIQIGGEKYSGSATFTCAGPGGWKGLQEMFINSFRPNPGAAFP